MIISHKHRFIFFAVPKTGTHSVRRALRLNLSPDDAEQVGLFEQKTLPQPELATIRHGHLSVRQVQQVLGHIFENYFKFSFVRNPFDRFVSYCAFVSRDSGEFARAPRDFMKHVIRNLRPLEHVLFRPQHEFLVDMPGVLQMDYVGRTETMQASYDEICHRLNLPTSNLDRVNASTHGSFADYYDSELIGLVLELYRQDFEMFSYHPEP